jgi:hypothetical protein
MYVKVHNSNSAHTWLLFIIASSAIQQLSITAASTTVAAAATVAGLSVSSTNSNIVDEAESTRVHV